MPQRATYLALGLTVLSCALVPVGWWLAAEHGAREFRIVGFFLGGVASVATLALCLYYLRLKGIRSFGVKVAASISAAYALTFTLLFAGLIAKLPLAAQVVIHAF